MKKQKNYEFEIIEHKPTKEELYQYQDSDEKPSEFIKEIMKGKSKAEMLFAENNYNHFLALAKRVSERITKEGLEKSREDLLNSKIRQDKLF